MLSQRGLVVVAAVGLLAAGIAAGCGDDSTNDHSGAGGSGATTSSTTTSTVSTTSNTTSTTTGPEDASFVAKACTSNSDCGDEPDAYCILAADDEPAFTGFFGVDDVVGGPAGGYCTKDCATDPDCPSDAVCVRDICQLECVFGEPVLTYLYDPPVAEKCHGRDELMCVPTQGGNALCMPVCGSDLECGGDRSCDLRSRVCTDAGRPGLPLGAPCVPDDDDDTLEDEDACAGFCLPFIDENEEPTAHMCSANCSLGGEWDVTLNCGGTENGICVYRAGSTSAATSEAGDYAFCTGSCAQHDECNHEEGFFCYDMGLLDDIGKGYCIGTTDCPDGNECGGGEGCFDTVYGPVCVEVDANGDPIFPLGDAAGTGGAGGAAGGAGGATGGAGGAGGN